MGILNLQLHLIDCLYPYDCQQGRDKSEAMKSLVCRKGKWTRTRLELNCTRQFRTLNFITTRECACLREGSGRSPSEQGDGDGCG